MLYTLHTGVVVDVNPELDSEAKTITAVVNLEAEKKSQLPIYSRLKALIEIIQEMYHSHLPPALLQEITSWGYPNERADDPRNPLVNYGITKYGMTRTTHPQTQDALNEAAQYFNERFIITHGGLFGGIFPVEEALNLGIYERQYTDRAIHIFKELMINEAKSN